MGVRTGLHSDHPAPDREPACARLPVRVVARSLDFYLALGCEVRRAADGWVLLTSGTDRFVLNAGAHPAAAPSQAAAPGDATPWELVLTVPDVRATWCRLAAAGLVPAVTDPTGDQIELLDPDGHRVMIRRGRRVVDRQR